MRQVIHNLTPILLVALALGGCDDLDNMRHQPRLEPFEATEFFENGTFARQHPEGTVPAGTINDIRLLRAGVEPVNPVEELEGLELLEFGQAKFEIWCTPCHGHAGYGNGMVVQRGYPDATSFHNERLRALPDAYYLRVIANGLGKMPPYEGHVDPAEARAIVAYIRALQFSQYAEVEALPPALREVLPAPAEDGASPAAPEVSP